MKHQYPLDPKPPRFEKIRKLAPEILKVVTAIGLVVGAWKGIGNYQALDEICEVAANEIKFLEIGEETTPQKLKDAISDNCADSYFEGNE